MTNFAYRLPDGKIQDMDVQKIGRYEIKSEIGRGGMATVFRAFDPTLKREVALKVLPREFLHDPTFRTRFEREAQTIATLKHPAIVPIYDVGEKDGQPYLVMPLLDGGTLTQRLKKGPLTLTDIVAILNRVAQALDFAHNADIIHRDLKPDNVLFDHHDDSFIADFGIAKLTKGSRTTLTSRGVVIGTPAYISPEQANGEELDGRTDIYSLGVILFEMLTGQLPFRANTPIGIIMKHITAPIPYPVTFNPQLPTDCNSIIAKVLAKSREERYSTATALAAAFTQVIDPNFTPWPDMGSIFDTGSFPMPAPPPPVSSEVPPAEVQQPVTDTGFACPKCKVINSKRQRFCLNCGQRLKIDCTLCHTENGIEAVVCSNCGGDLKQLQMMRQGLDEARQRAMTERAQTAKEKEAQQIRERIQNLFRALVIRRKRKDALDQLNRLDQQTLEVLRDVLISSQDAEARRLIARTFGLISGRVDIKMPIRQFAMNALIDAVEDPDPQVRQQAQEILERFGGRRGRDVSDLFNGLLGWIKKS